MSQPRSSSRETQALVQSMLQRLKLQPGTEIQGGFLPATPAGDDWDQNRDRAPHQQTLGGSPAQNGFGTASVDFPGTSTDGDIIGEGLPDEGKRWDSREEIKIPTLDSNLDNSATRAKGNGEQDLFNGPILDGGQEMARLNSPKAFPFTACKDNTAGDSVESGGMGQTVTSSAVSGSQFPVNTQHTKDAKGTSFAGTNCKMEGGNYISDVMSGTVSDDGNVHSLGVKSTSASQHSTSSKWHSRNPGMTAESGASSQTVSINGEGSPSPVQGFSSRLYAWSLKGPSTGSGQIPTTHQGHDQPGPLVQSQDVEIGSKMPNNTLAPLQRNRASGSRTKRWTQRIKEKFKERSGSFKKRQEEAEKEEVKVEDEGRISTQNEYQNTEDASSMSNKTLETTSKPTDMASLNLEDSAAEMRSNNDFDIGLGSFSLLEEIKIGQYWANFLSPAMSDSSTSQRPTEQHAGQSDIAALARLGEDNKSFGDLEPQGDPGVAVTATPSADLPVPFTMDTSELDGNPVAMVTDPDPRAEPMEEHSQSDAVSKEQGASPGEGDQNTGVVNNMILKSQIHRNRKRAHRWSLERTGPVGKAEGGGEGGGKRPSQGELLSFPGLANNPATVEKVLDLYPIKSPQVPSSLVPREFVPKSVLKHTQSTDTDCTMSMETAAKKRRMEPGRRVHFSDEVVAIEPVVMDVSMDTDSEEESQREEGSETEEGGVAPGPGPNEASEAPPRSPTLPGWIRALKRKSGRKPKR